MKNILVAVFVIFVLFLSGCENDVHRIRIDKTVDVDSSEDIDDIDDTNDTDGFDSGDSNLEDSENIDDAGEMVTVSAGSFQMGCNESVDDKCGNDEKPYHEVTLAEYKIDKYEVTVSQYQACIDNGACNNDNENEPHYATENAGSDCNITLTDRGNHPMNCVTWFGAKVYCEWLGKRLPTEAEWEKAARGTDGRIYPWGNEPEPDCEHAVMNDADAGGYGCGNNGTMEVGSKLDGRSPYGAYDMAGNVWEWVNDWFDLYNENSAEGPETGTYRVLRGGSWYDNDYMRTSFRNTYEPVLGYGNSGFRCVK
ncbi:MAG TPA: formylglycine-generating enzyme family protein [bacterium]|nr:formylglycine-generating enzyme family protein [bacterium]HPS31702.1 formylglycine-generating enzyme family protein [bacterium]